GERIPGGRRREVLQRPVARPRPARRHLGERRHAPGRHPHHPAELVLAARRGTRSRPASPERPMDELIQQLTAYLRGMWQRRWIGLAAAWVAAIIGVAVAMRIPERHEAS